MDNNYNGQNQYGQNTFGQSSYSQEAFGQPSYNQEAFGQRSNAYDQFNQQTGQNTYNQFNQQNSYNQNAIPTYNVPQYQQSAYNYPSAQGSYYGAPQFEQPKKKSGWIALLGVVIALAIVVGLVFIVKFAVSSFDITDYDKIKNAAKDELGVAIVKYNREELAEDIVEMGMVEYAEGMGDLGDTEAEVMWIRFDSQTTAKEFYTGFTLEYESQYELEKDDCKSHSKSSTGTKFECSLVYKDEPDTRYSVLIVQKEDIFFYVQVMGDKDEVKKNFKSFKKAIR